ncbi:site-specific DNA-methyltransferase [bacterium]|nr:site-specific DNA-methyltransferase [bacterium]
MTKKDFQNWSREKLLHEYKELLKRKKFGIVWEDKPEDVAEQCKTSLPVLKEEKKKDISSDKNDVTHIIIEGDNYHALSVLNYTHRRKIDVIYIDPPYNNGKKSWQYNNDYVDKEDRFFHSKWLSFMSKRLRLAKNLLTEKGVLICAIDHNEQEALGLLLKEIFPGKEITCITVIHNPGGIQGNNFSYTHEYAYFVYPTGGRFIELENRQDNPDIRPLRDVSTGNHLRTDAANCFYPIFVKDQEIIGFGEVCKPNFHPKTANIKRKNGIIEIYPIDAQGNERKWVFSRQSVEDIKNELTIEYNKKRKIFDVIRKKEALNYKTVWTDKKYNANAYGTKLLAQIIDIKFPYPKSLYTVKDCVKAAVHDKDSAVILDFFAGSGTTGHAILELNKEDSGQRQFILCTNNEDNNGSGKKIAADICYPRIKKVMQGYIGNRGKIAGLGGSLKYFSTEFVDNVKTDNDKRVFTSKCSELLCLAESTFYEVVSKKGAFAIYENANQMTGIIYDEDAISDFKKEAKKHKKTFVVYVFSYDHTYNEEDFEDLENLRMVKPIPEVILNVYRKIYKELYKPRHL